ncbi:MAG TPA: MotA/TolQ/ExbB proton channel family protein [Pirellulaceae bacterium]|jgi:biopolymer transport protein ExbB|nr:MotA/TolQ/ExbB proton channel family protein [Pirellulaceae bacterium]
MPFTSSSPGDRPSRKSATSGLTSLATRARAFRWIATGALLLSVGFFVPGNWSTAFAQEGDDPAAFEAEPATTPGGSAASAQDEEEPNVLVRNLYAAGWIGALIGVASLVAVGFIIEHFVTLRRARLMPEDVLIDLEQMIQEGRLDDAIAYCEQPHADSLAAHVVQAGLERFRSSEFGFADYKYAVEEAGEDETAKLYRKTEVLGVIGAIAPMLGLLGTVAGMISAFNIIAEKEGAARPDELAGSIGQALVTTFLGLIVAIPCTIFFSFFRNRIDSIVAEAGKRVERVLSPLGRQR